MSKIKKFSLNAVLCIVTERLFPSPDPSDDHNGIDQVYLIIDHMTGISNMTHMLSGQMERCKPWLLEEFPRFTANRIDRIVEAVNRICEKHGDDSEAIRTGLREYVESMVTEGFDRWYPVPGGCVATNDDTAGEIFAAPLKGKDVVLVPVIESDD